MIPTVHQYGPCFSDLRSPVVGRVRLTDNIPVPQHSLAIMGAQDELSRRETIVSKLGHSLVLERLPALWIDHLADRTNHFGALSLDSVDDHGEIDSPFSACVCATQLTPLV